MSKEKGTIELTGQIAHVIFEKNGFVILRVLAKGRVNSNGEEFSWEDSKGTTEICVKGTMLNPARSADYTFKGKLTENQYGVQLEFDSFSRARPLTQKSITDYLANNCEGVGRKTAEAIFKKYGEQSIEMLKTSPTTVASEVSGLSVEKAVKAASVLSDIEDGEKLNLQVASLVAGTTAHKGHIKAIIKKYRSDAPTIISTDPYRLVQVSGVGFKVADSIAIKNGVDLDSPQRISACADYVIKNWERSGGHTCCPYEVLIKRILAETNLAENLIGELMREHIESGLFHQIGEHVYRKSMYKLESGIASMLSKLMGYEPKPVEPMIEGLEDDQADAVRTAATRPVMLMTGAPGTGKTFTIKKICETFTGHKIALCAQTGKASRRITESTGREATTIHRLLKPAVVDSADGGGMVFSFTHGKTRPIDHDVVIVDEASLLDVELAHSLISAIPVGARLILVGDPDQLPSVGAGKVLVDLIASRSIPHVALTKIKRQGADSLIVRACHAIKAGDSPEIENVPDSDLFMWGTSGDNKTISSTMSLFTERIPDKFNYSMDDIQIVTPNKSPEKVISTYRINNELQKTISSGYVITGSEKSIGKKAKITFRIGDRVINTRNSKVEEFTVGPDDGWTAAGFTTKQTDIVNGDIGVITGVHWKGNYYDNQKLSEMSDAPRSAILDGKPKDLRLIVKFDDVTVALKPKKNELDLAYAVTCHKFQGSECPVVIIPLPQGANNLMCRSWIYTALSRGKELVVVTGPKEAFGFACMTPDRKRDTFLSNFLCQALKDVNEDQYGVSPIVDTYKDWRGNEILAGKVAADDEDDIFSNSIDPKETIF